MNDALRKRIPSLLVAVGLIGVSLYPRYLPASAPHLLRNDFVVGLGMGIFLGIELVGAVWMIRQRRKYGTC